MLGGLCMYKRIISLILTLIMLITIVPSTIVAASEVRSEEHTSELRHIEESRMPSSA